MAIRNLATYLLLLFGLLFSSSLILFEYSHINKAGHDLESPLVLELKRQLAEKEDLIQELRVSQVSEDNSALDQNLNDLELSLQKQVELESQITQLEERVAALSKNSESFPPDVLPSDSNPKTVARLQGFGAPVLKATPEQQELQDKFFNDYVETYKKIWDPSEPDTSVRKQYLVITSSGSGTGNEIEATVSALMFAILTKRALIIKNSVNGILTAANPGVHLGGEIPSQYRGDQKYISFRGGVDEFTAKMPFYELLACGDYDSITERVLEISSNQWYGPLIINNRKYSDMWKTTFGKDVFGPVYRFFLKMSESTQTKVNNYVRDVFKDYFVIGIHMRQEYIRNRQHPLAEMVFFRCAQQITPNVPGLETRYYLATDDSQYRKLAREIFGDKLLTGDGSVDLDLMILGECDDVIGTSGSTFSEVAFARASKIPHKVTEVQLCMRDVTSQPCFFFYKLLLETTCFAPKDFYDPILYDNPIFLNQRNCYFNFQWGMDHI